MTDAQPRALFQLAKSLGCTWEHLTKADQETDNAQRDLLALLSKEVGEKFASEDANVVVFGSLARREWIDYVSDLDWTYLIDGQAKSPHLKISQNIVDALRTEFRTVDVANDEGRKRKEYRFSEPGPTGTFGNMTFSHELVHRIGFKTTRTGTLLNEFSCCWSPKQLDPRTHMTEWRVRSSKDILRKNQTS
jgi:predicted nucleotidyltransferase